MDNLAEMQRRNAGFSRREELKTGGRQFVKIVLPGGSHFSLHLPIPAHLCYRKYLK